MSAIPTYPICPVCKNFQGTFDEDVAKHLKEVHGVLPGANKPVDYKEALKDLQVREAELANKEKELAQWEKELTERDKRGSRQRNSAPASE